ncbi:MAG: ECF-type sigma factor, partial [Planctomycetota bacterium]
MAEITQILQRITAGDEGAKDELVPLVYQQLRKIAQNQLAGEASPQMDATELVHEAYVRLIGPAHAPTVAYNKFAPSIEVISAGCNACCNSRSGSRSAFVYQVQWL